MSWGEIKKAVNSDLSKPLNTLIEEKTGAVNATGGTTTTGGIFAKLNKLLTDWTTSRAGKIDNIDTNVSALAAGKVVKSVQRGEYNQNTTKYNNNPYVVSFAAVNPSKSMVILNNGVAAVDADIEAFSATSLTVSTRSIFAYDPTSSPTSAIRFSWQIIEFY